ncbi:MAG: SusC/RagA family TonB-linked outer membrane protein, partial [Adhaeribacter sp.]|nr:SusC/RagA family TonB-linked outer membrane protein [Adhaeribacter sp.]
MLRKLQSPPDWKMKISGLILLATLVAGPYKGFATAHVAHSGVAVAFTKEMNAKKIILWQITGRVSSSTGDPMPGVTVLLKGTTTGATTATDGTYTLSVPEAAGTLVFSFIGHTSLERNFSGPGVVNATLTEDAKALQEIVVTGYT